MSAFALRRIIRGACVPVASDGGVVDQSSNDLAVSDLATPDLAMVPVVSIQSTSGLYINLQVNR